MSSKCISSPICMYSRMQHRELGHGQQGLVEVVFNQVGDGWFVRFFVFLCTERSNLSPVLSADGKLDCQHCN